MNTIEALRQGFESAYIDANVTSNLAVKPQFVSNNYKIDELSKKIDIENLSKKLNNELSIIKEKIKR